MKELKYKVITNKIQYKEYCSILEELVFSGSRDRIIKDEIDLLTLLVEKWDDDHNTFSDLNPVEMLSALMNDHQLKAKDLVNILGVSKGYVSDMLNYKKGFSKDIIRKLAHHFKMNQEAFNRTYKLNIPRTRMLHTNAKNISVQHSGRLR